VVNSLPQTHQNRHVLPQAGLSLVELLVATAILGMLAAAATQFTFTALRAQAAAEWRSTVRRDGMLAMERIAAGIKTCSFLLIPNSTNSVRSILAISGTDNDDNDFYFNDPLFPRIDEDPNPDMTSDGYAGIKGMDDDGDGATDEGNYMDDDEDGQQGEELLDGEDNDGDGNVDEDLAQDMSGDGKAGIAGMDDDGNGVVDDRGTAYKMDNDEDGRFYDDNIHPIVFALNAATKTLNEINRSLGQSNALVAQVTRFQVTYVRPGLVRIEMDVQDADGGESITFTESVYARNTLQKTGKRVK
jgi:prepilin-type N-terminal cleavage/methylation domain-containing protein